MRAWPQAGVWCGQSMRRNGGLRLPDPGLGRFQCVLYLSITRGHGMATVTLRNLGGSIVMAVPKKILSLVALEAGSQVEVSVEGGRLIVEPKKKPQTQRPKLLSACRGAARIPREKQRP